MKQSFPNIDQSLFVAWTWPLHAIMLNETLSYTARSASLCPWLRLLMWHNNLSRSDAQRAPVVFYNSRCTYMSGFLLDNRLSAWLTINRLWQIISYLTLTFMLWMIYFLNNVSESLTELRFKDHFVEYQVQNYNSRTDAKILASF